MRTARLFILSLCVPFFAFCQTEKKDTQSRLKQYAENIATFGGSFIVARTLEQGAHYIACKLTGLEASINTTSSGFKINGLFNFYDDHKKIASSTTHFIAGPLSAGIIYYSTKKLSFLRKYNAAKYAALVNLVLSIGFDGHHFLEYLKEIKTNKSNC